ncbi:MAG: hypothetical protein ACREJN_20220 [Nitrospiraceae bacterium]
MTDTDAGGGVEGPTLAMVVRTLVRKRWVSSHRTLNDRRVVCVRLIQQSEVLARRITERIQDMRSDLISMKET